jgi:hypothetical protein
MLSIIECRKPQASDILQHDYFAVTLSMIALPDLPGHADLAAVQLGYGTFGR